MAYRKNDDHGRVTGFKDGAPVYRKTNRPSGGRNEQNRGGYRRDGEQGRGEKTYSRPSGGRNSEGERSYYNSKQTGERGRTYNRKPDGEDRTTRYGEGGPKRPYEGRRDGYSKRPYDGRAKSGIAKHDEEIRKIRPPKEHRRYDNLKPLPQDVPEKVDAEPVELPNIIMGRNPVKEAIKSGRSIDRILVNKEHDGSLNEILDLAYDAKLVVRDVDRAKLDEICMPFGHNGKTGNHQGIIAYVPGVEYCELDDILEYAEVRGEAPFVILLDGIEDPNNLGSIIRSAECAGAHGVVITKRRSASVTAAVVKTSAGATEHMRIAKVVNLASAIERLKEAGVWVAGADMDGETVYNAKLKGPFALVVGAEGAGISRLVKEKCDFIVSVPLKGEIGSLNASVAAAVIMFEKIRQESVK